MFRIPRVSISMRELDRLKCIQGLIDKQLKQKAVAERLGLTARQVRRPAVGKLAPPRRQIVHLHRAVLEDRQPIRILGQATEYDGILFGVEYRLKVIARLRGNQARGERQSALGV